MTPFLLCSYFRAHPTTLYFSKYWGDGCMDRPPPQIWGENRPPVPLGLRPWFNSNRDSMNMCLTCSITRRCMHQIRGSQPNFIIAMHLIIAILTSHNMCTYRRIAYIRLRLQACSSTRGKIKTKLRNLKKNGTVNGKTISKVFGFLGNFPLILGVFL